MNIIYSSWSPFNNTIILEKTNFKRSIHYSKKLGYKVHLFCCNNDLDVAVESVLTSLKTWYPKLDFSEDSIAKLETDLDGARAATASISAISACSTGFGRKARAEKRDWIARSTLLGSGIVTETCPGLTRTAISSLSRLGQKFRKQPEYELI